MKPHAYTDAEWQRMIDEARDSYRISDLVSRRTDLKRAGRELVGLCLFHEEHTPSMRVNDAKGTYHCFGCGATGGIINFVMRSEGLRFFDAVHWLRRADLPVISAAERVKAAEEDAADRARAVADALALWNRCGDPVGTPAEVYARSRGITIPLPPSIRFGNVPAWRDRDTDEWTKDIPAMVCAGVDAEGYLVAIQRIFLRNGGKAKAAMKKPKLTLGRIRGAALRLGPPQPEVIVCEGPEDGLSLMQELAGASVWVSFGTALMADIEYPPEVRRVTLAGDNNPAGRAAIARAAEELSLRGMSVKTMFPAPEFEDWNDQLRGVRI